MLRSHGSPRPACRRGGGRPPHAPGVAFEHLVAHVSHLGAQVPGLVHDPDAGALEVGLHGGQQVRRADADDGGRRRLGGEHDQVVLLRLPRGEEVLQRPLQRVVAVLAVVDAHQHHRLRPRRRDDSVGRLLGCGHVYDRLSQPTNVSCCLIGVSRPVS
jgi:hypothetical protein